MILASVKLAGVVGSAVAFAAAEPIAWLGQSVSLLDVVDHYASTINTALLIVLYFITVKNRKDIRDVAEDTVGEVINREQIQGPDGTKAHVVTKLVPERRKRGHSVK